MGVGRRHRWNDTPATSGHLDRGCLYGPPESFAETLARWWWSRRERERQRERPRQRGADLECQPASGPHAFEYREPVIAAGLASPLALSSPPRWRF